MSGLYRNVYRQIFRTAVVRESRKCPSPKVDPPEHEGKFKSFKRISLFICLPIIIGLSASTFLKEEGKEREPFHKYPYLRMRSKPFPWGDGQKTFFHNPKLNALPDGYEDEEESS